MSSKPKYLTCEAELIRFHDIQFLRNWQMPRQRILVTGGLGFIFSYVVEWLHQVGHEVVVLDNECDGANIELGKVFEKTGIRVVRKNVGELVPGQELFKDDGRYDYIIHAAAESDVDKSIDNCNRHLFVESNIAATFSILEWAQEIRSTLKKFLFVNTDEVYGSVIEPASVGSPLNPSSLYSAAKASAGLLCHSYNVTHGLPIMECRMCNIIGHRQALTKVLPKAINCTLSSKPFPLHGDGTATREYLDVRQVPIILEYFLYLSSMGALATEGHFIFNITSRQEYTVKEVIAEVEAVLQSSMTVQTANRKGLDMHYRMWPHPLLESLDFVPLEDTVRWMCGKPVEHAPVFYSVVYKS